MQNNLSCRANKFAVGKMDICLQQLIKASSIAVAATHVDAAAFTLEVITVIDSFSLTVYHSKITRRALLISLYLT